MQSLMTMMTQGMFGGILKPQAFYGWLMIIPEQPISKARTCRRNRPSNYRLMGLSLNYSEHWNERDDHIFESCSSILFRSRRSMVFLESQQCVVEWLHFSFYLYIYVCIYSFFYLPSPPIAFWRDSFGAVFWCCSRIQRAPSTIIFYCLMSLVFVFYYDYYYYYY